MSDSWVQSWKKARIPFTSEKDMKLQEKGLRSLDTDKEISVSLPNDIFSLETGLVVIPRKILPPIKKRTLKNGRRKK